MVIKIVEDRAENHKERCEYIAREIFDKYGDRNPEYDVLEDAINIISQSNISDDVWQMMDSADYSEESMYKAFTSLSSEDLDRMENKLAQVNRRYTKYADIDKESAYIDYLHGIED